MNDARLTRRHVLAGIGAAAVAAGVAACGHAARRVAASAGGVDPTDSPLAAPGASPSISPAPTPSTSPTQPASRSTTRSSPSPSRLDEAALRRAVASLLVVGFRGSTVTSDGWIVRAIRGGLGGVILFDRDQLTGNRRNISTPTQVAALVRALRHASPGRLIVSLDQEGGRIARLNPADGFPGTKSEAEIGAADSTATTRAWASSIARSVAGIGANLNYAPVVDLNVNPHNPAIGALGRSFSASTDVVVACATEEIKAHRAAGVRTVLKHFPGFGSATGNTDFGVVDVTKTWHRSELEPFRRLIAAGSADAVMVAHLLNRKLDSSKPVSLSRAVVHDLLRGQLHWSGPVVSDDMQAVAITSRYGRAEAVTLAVEAGVDLLVFANQGVYDTHVVDETVDTIVNLVKRGRVSQAQVEASAARVDRLRPPG
jgi:beta-N-acetylhexosaminidase